MNTNVNNSFRVKFNMQDYKHLIPKELNDDDLVINFKHRKKGDLHLCVWKKQIPKVFTPEWEALEVMRVLKTGALCCIKDDVVWLPPNYYFALQYGRAGDDPLEFRLKRLKHVYFKIEARHDPRCIGTYTVKNRQDGETTMATTDAFWECLDGNMTNGQIGIQSKTRNDAFNPCWRSIQILWQGLPRWLKRRLCSDFASGDKIAEKMQFMREADENGANGRNIYLSYFPSVHNAMDGLNNMKKCILDEINKWKECHFYDTFNNYLKFIMPGMERKGMFDIFSSPADVNGWWNDEAYAFWKGSKREEKTETGTTATRVWRYYSDPLEGIQGAYDEYGDADSEKIYNHIIRERENVKKTKPDKLMGEIRGYPLNEEEMFGAFDNQSIWDNHRGISARKIFLIGQRFKDQRTQEPARVYGNLEWKDGVMDTEVEFRMADKSHFDVKDARFSFSHIPLNKEPLKNPFKPPLYVESCLGIDPYNLRYKGKDVHRQSDAAMVNHKFFDLFDTGVVKCPTMIYCCRPHHQEIMFEDAIKAAVFNRSLVQYENRSDKLANHFEDRGYFEWLLPEIGQPRDSVRKGDAPSGKGKFLQEGMALVNAITQVPIREGEPYLLERNWFIELLDDVLRFNPNDTQANNLTMAWIQALIGAAKIMHKKIKTKSEVNDAVLDYLLN